MSKLTHIFSAHRRAGLTVTLLAGVVMLAACPKSEKPRVDGKTAPATATAADLHLRLDPSVETFSGSVDYDIDISETGKKLVFDAIGLTVSEATLTYDGSSEDLQIATSETDGKLVLARRSQEKFPSGDVIVSLDFRGKFHDKIGLFKQSFAGNDYIFTDFQPEDARRAFPCFDDPEQKLPWTIHITSPKGMVALSNMPATEATDAPKPPSGGVLTTFEPTPPLPSYLVAAAVGMFEKTETSDTPMPVNFYYPKGGLQANVAASLIPGVFKEVRKLFPYDAPFPKVDFVAVPTFNGAMENPGLITVSLGILVDRDTRGASGITWKRLLALVLTHEVIHLWVGDSMTLTDWHELWIHEGITTWLSNKVLIKSQGALGYTELDWLEQRYLALDIAWDPDTVPIQPQSKIDADKLFAPSSYEKAGAVVYMMEEALPDGVLLAAISDLLQKHKFGSFSAAQLRRKVAVSQKKDEVWGSYLSQKGIPILSAKIKCQADIPSEAVLQVSQTPWIKRSKNQWNIPLCYRYGSEKVHGRSCKVITKRTAQVPLAGAKTCPQWAVIDPSVYALSRTSLSEIKALNEHLTEPERYNLARSAMALFRSGHLPAKKATEQARELAKAGSLITQAAVIRDFDMLFALAQELGLGREFSRYFRELYQDDARKLGWQIPIAETSYDKLRFRKELVSRYVRWTADTKMFVRGRSLLTLWQKGGLKLHVDELRTLLEGIVPRLSKSEVSELLESTRSQAERLEVLVASRGNLPKKELQRLGENNRDSFQMMAILFGLAKTVRGRQVASKMGATETIDAALHGEVVCDKWTVRQFSSYHPMSRQCRRLAETRSGVFSKFLKNN